MGLCKLGETGAQVSKVRPGVFLWVNMQGAGKQGKGREIKKGKKEIK